MNKAPDPKSFAEAPTLREHARAAEAKGFDHVDTWVFDLDNTLYPASSRLFDQIDA